MSVNFKPDGYHTVTPYLIVEDADKLVEFLEKTFDGKLLIKMTTDAGRISHGEMKIGDSILMLAEATGEWKPTRTLLYFYVEDVDAVYQKALDAGATPVKELQDQFYGDRSATVEDSFGNHWGIATHIEDVSEAEIEKRIAAMSSKAEEAETSASAG